MASDPLAQGGIGRHQQDPAGAQHENNDIEHEGVSITTNPRTLGPNRITAPCEAGRDAVKTA